MQSPIYFEKPEIQNGFRWTAECQRRFLEILAETGSVQRASDAVSKSRKTAYALRRRSAGTPFATGWDAALLIAQHWLCSQMLEYAMQPQEYEGYRHPETYRLMWRGTNPLLGRGQGMALLSRVDAAVAKFSADPLRMARAKDARHDWQIFLETVCETQPFMCNLARDSASFSSIGEKADPPKGAVYGH